ncbi:MAG: cytochrome ubiquinol oxidase subunit I, partial [Bacteroidales bacterium]|nr:cytochrome ubiquinol oxidase subunit I [Bacteroidales bacterium]
MNYPVWELETIGGGTLIAIIAVVHVLVSHFAVGGGLFLVLTEIKARRENDAAMLAYVKSHTSFFLLLTMVFGGLSGVGIWFIIALVNPAATSSLIHNFVFGWATEWVFFIAEITALLIYHYRFDKMEPRNHIITGWLYFIFAWLSLFIINGILGFMLTPGKWIETGNFWHGFFNPSFFPSLVFRTGIALFLAGLFGLVTAVYNKNKELRKRFFRYNIQWMFLPFLVIFTGGLWYLQVVPETSLENLFKYNPAALKFIHLLLTSTVLIFAIGILFLLKLPHAMHKVSVYLLILVGLGWMGGFEYMREIARKPYVLNQLMYSNSVYREDVKMLNDEGFLYHAKWVQSSEITDETLLASGKELFKFQCHSCHTINGYNAIFPRTQYLTERGVIAQLTGQGKINTYMPPFLGTEKEKAALAAYIFRELQGKTPEPLKEVNVKGSLPELPPFDKKNSEYLILAWNDLGMHCISDNDKYFSFLPPANTLWAQVIKRGSRPEILSSGIRLEYAVEEGFEKPEDHVPFWEYAETVYGVKLEKGQGLAGNRV